MSGGTSSTLTFLFTDIEGSTRQWEESPGMHERVERHFAALRRVVEAGGGEVFATMGDGIAAAFSSVDGAVQAAIAGQQAMSPIGLAVRMGVHTGEVERVSNGTSASASAGASGGSAGSGSAGGSGSTGGGVDFRGRPVNRAARIMAVGHGGQILVSDITAALLRTGPSPVELIDLGARQLKDLDDPERVWQVVHPELDGHFPPVRGLDTCSNNLPVQRSSLVGRDHDVARVVGLLHQHRIVTLTGPGGVGKTRLGIQAAMEQLDRFCNVWFVELASVADPDDVADAIALAVGAAGVNDPLAAATAMLAGENTLLVLDNCEHVVDSAAAVIDALTNGCPNLAVIATSREALGIEGEHVVTVRSLDPSGSAVELFLQRATAAGADLPAIGPVGLPGVGVNAGSGGGVTVERSDIEHLCRRLDGIPLAIELAAARCATLGVATIIDGLDDRFSLLSGGRRRAIDRHGTMRATIEWSHRLLDRDERQLFQWLSAFPNGFALDAAQNVAASLGISDAAATEHVASLVQQSMVVAEPSAHGVRYRMLETMRAYGLEQLDEHGTRLDALTALAEWVTTITDLSFDDPCNAVVERNAIRLERESDSWRDAVMLAARLGSDDLGARLCGPPVAFFLLGRHDLADFVRPLLDLCPVDADADAESDTGAGAEAAVSVRRRQAVLCALMVSAAGATEADQLQAWADEMWRLDDLPAGGGPTGLGGLMGWLASTWQGDFSASVDICTRASQDLRLARSTRDLFVGIATLDRFSLTDATDDPDGLVPRALEVATRSDVAMHRVTCMLGAAWGLADTQPDRSLDLVRQALDDIANVPALTRQTLPGGASRLLSRLDPRVAAQGLLEQLDATPSRRSFVDLIPLFYATALLQRQGHPAAESALALFAASPIAPYLSMMDVVDLARRAASPGSHGSLGELEATVRAALADVIDATNATDPGATGGPGDFGSSGSFGGGSAGGGGDPGDDPGDFGGSGPGWMGDPVDSLL
jgi:predicted ATPase/class 3 adenylate cyclase